MNFARNGYWSLKRFLLCLIPCALVFVPLLGGCRREQPDTGIIELTYADAISATTDKTVKAALSEFMREHPHIRVRRVSVAGDYYSKLMVMIAGNTAPDVMWMGAGFGEFARRGAFLDISPMERELKPDEYFSSVIDWYRLDKKLYGFPYGIDCMVIAYNKDLFRKAKVPFPREDWKLDDFVKISRALMEPQRARKTPEYFAFGSFGSESLEIGTFGAQLLSADNQKCLLASPQGIEAMQFNYDLKERYRVSAGPSAGSDGGLNISQDFKLGKLAMVTMATWDLPTFQKEIKSFDWDVVLPPKGKRRAVWASSSGLAVYARTPHPREAMLLLKHLASPPLQLQLGIGTGAVPTHRATAQKWLRVMKRPPENLKAFVETVPFLEPKPRVVALSQINSEYERARERVLLKRATPTQGMRDAARKIDKIIERQNRLLARQGGKP